MSGFMLFRAGTDGETSFKFNIVDSHPPNKIKNSISYQKSVPYEIVNEFERF